VLPVAASFTTAMPVNFRGEQTGKSLAVRAGTFTFDRPACAAAIFVLKQYRGGDYSEKRGRCPQALSAAASVLHRADSLEQDAGQGRCSIQHPSERGPIAPISVTDGPVTTVASGFAAQASM
jgi:hypothetical protein